MYMCVCIHIYVHTHTHTPLHSHSESHSMTITCLVSVLWHKIKMFYQSFLEPELTKMHPPQPLYEIDSAFPCSIV